MPSNSEKNAAELAAIAQKHGLAAALQTFVDGILDRMIFDGEQLGELMAPLDLDWKACTQAELALWTICIPCSSTALPVAISQDSVPMPSKKKTTATKEESKPAIVPKLRFLEFRVEKGWTEKPFNVVAQMNPAKDGLPESFIYIDLESVEAGKLKAKNRISREGAPSRA